MYDIRQFKPLLYVLIILGMTGFALAAQAPLLWFVAVAGVLLNAWLVRQGMFRPLPRFIAGLITLLLFGLTIVQVRAYGPTHAVIVLGQFLVFLQLVKLYEQRGNRDYAQLLVLSLLLMVAAAINTASLLFAILFTAYLFLSLYCCLLFHLKVEADQAREAISIPEEKLNPGTLRQDQRYFTSSMRRLTGLVAVVSVSFAVGVFLFFPRGTGAGILAPLQFQPRNPLTGFSEQVSFQDLARITQSHEEVAKVELFRDGERVAGTMPLLLRGVTLDVYENRQWRRSRGLEAPSHTIGANSAHRLSDEPVEEEWLQRISLRPTGTRVLFALPGAAVFRPAGEMTVRFSPRDEVLQSDMDLVREVRYEVVSRNTLGSARPRRGVRSQIDPLIYQYARRDDVSGGLVEQRGSGIGPHELDEQIARHIEQHLQTEFTYTLDLTDARRIRDDEDPLVAFLHELRRGHCEYFAGAMALMCQSLGMYARVVVGFKCDEYNPYLHAYTVRQSHAHAWVEVLTPDGWKTFDPTSGRETPRSAMATHWQRLRHLFAYLEHKWADNVVAYDDESRGNLIQSLETQLGTAAAHNANRINRVRDWLETAQYWLLHQVLGVLVGLMLAALVAAVGWFLFEKWRLRRRAARIGIGSLPPSDQVRLAKQLGFYDDLMRLLERSGVERPRHLTPLEFSRSLVFLPSDVYDGIGRLTDLFYRIRFGNAELRKAQHRRVQKMVARIEQRLQAVPLA